MSYNTKVRTLQGGDVLEIAEGGELRLSGGLITNAGTVATAIADVTDSTGATADGTIDDVSTAVTGVDGAGSNAASKADVDTALVAINENFAELADKVNDILAALRGAGVVAS